MKLILLPLVKKVAALGVLVCSLLASSSLWADTKLTIEFEIPQMDAKPYFRPYVAIWLETPERKPLDTLVMWYMVENQSNSQEDGKKWLKDLRQWWRKIGRKNNPSYDAVTGATRKPGSYRLEWTDSELPTVDLSQQLVVHIEAAREEGGRTYHKIPLTNELNEIGIANRKTESRKTESKKTESKKIENRKIEKIIQAENELGKIHITLEYQSE